MAKRTLTCGVRGEPQYLTGMDLFSSHAGIPAVLVYPGGLDVGALERSLVATLREYPVLCGRIRTDADGHAYVDCNDAGVAFEVRAHEEPLPAYGVERPIGREIRRFHTPIRPWRVVDRDQPPLTVEVHTFADGGAILSVTFVHSICDGSSFWSFMNDWSMVHRGQEIAAPSMDRNAVIARSRENASAPYTRGLLRATSLLTRLGAYLSFFFGYVFSLERLVFRIRRDDIRRWKQESEADVPETKGRAISPSAIIVAHCLKLLSARMRSPRERYIGIVGDMRFRSGLGIPRKYVGSAVGQSEVVLTREDLAREGVTALARRITERTEASIEELSTYMGFMEQHRQRKSVSTLFGKCLLETLNAGVLLNNGLGFPVYELDFGTGRPSWYEHPRPPFRYLVLVRSPETDGSVDVHLTAHRRELVPFASYARKRSVPLIGDAPRR